MPSRMCMLWTGGKDCFTAYLLASRALGTAESDWLFVTFVPPSGDFRCHPLGLMKRQSDALGVTHLFAVVDPVGWQTSYRESFRCLRDSWNVGRVFSGDILFGGSGAVENYWLVRMLEDLGMEATFPLAGMYAGPLFERIEEYGIDAVVTGVAGRVGASDMVGSTISLENLHARGLYRNDDFDLAGEQGEYHTSVVSGAGLRFASHDEVAPAGRYERVGDVDVALTDPALLRLPSPRIDLTSGSDDARNPE